MKFLALLLLASLGASPLWGAALTESIFSQVVKDVKVVARATETATTAKVKDVFKSPDLIRTGADSLAELIAADKTVTRVGANTVFSFDKAGRAINLEQGSVLFHSPKGKGGGTIRTKGASAAVLGTTIVVTATVGGGFKAIVLEGKGQITLPNGNFRILQAGQVTFVLPGSQRFGPQLNINIQKLVENSRLVQGFEQELPSLPVIKDAFQRQNQTIAEGGLQPTNQDLAPGPVTEETVTVVDSTIIQQVVATREDRLAVAKRTDLTISPASAVGGTADPGATAAHLFLDRVPFDIPVLGNLNFSGVVGRDITIASSVSQLDFSSYLNQVDFGIGATERLELQSSSLSLVGSHLGLLQDLRLVGRLGLTLPSGSSLQAFHVGDLHLLTGGTMSLNNVSFLNAHGQLHLNAGTVLDLTGGGVNTTPSMLLEGATVSLNGGSYNVTGTATVSAGRDILMNSGSPQFQANTIRMNAARDATLTGVQASGFSTLTVAAVNNLNVASGSFTASAMSPAATATLTAGEELTVNGTSVSGVASVSMSARTLNLSNITFPSGSTVNLYSQNGQLARDPNTGAPSMPLHVNFIVNVNYGSQRADLFLGQGINILARP